MRARYLSHQEAVVSYLPQSHLTPKIEREREREIWGEITCIKLTPVVMTHRNIRFALHLTTVLLYLSLLPLFSSFLYLPLLPPSYPHFPPFLTLKTHSLLSFPPSLMFPSSLPHLNDFAPSLPLVSVNRSHMFLIFFFFLAIKGACHTTTTVTTTTTLLVNPPSLLSFP